MTYSAWQLGKLVRALLGYRALKARNGRKPSWEEVRDALLLSKATVAVFPKDGTEPKLKSEALRRFAAGDQSSMEDEKLDDLKRFLIAEDLLEENEFVNGGGLLKEALALHSRVAVIETSKLHQMVNLPPLFSAARFGDKAAERINLRIIARPLPSLYLVEEEYNFEVNDTSATLTATTYRTGYLFVSTEQGGLNIYLKGLDGAELMQCVQVYPFAHGSQVDIHMLRLGSPDLGIGSGDSTSEYLQKIGHTVYYAEYPDIDSRARARGGYFL